MFYRVRDCFYLVGKEEIILALFALTPLYQELHYLFPVSGFYRLDRMPVFLPEFVNLAADLEIFFSRKLHKVGSPVYVLEVIEIWSQQKLRLKSLNPLCSLRVNPYKGLLIVAYIKCEPYYLPHEFRIAGTDRRMQPGHSCGSTRKNHVSFHIRIPVMHKTVPADHARESIIDMSLR